MKILAVADEECAALWDYYQPGRLDGINLILSCGDLKASYLTFLVTMGRARLCYVHGNHDESYSSHPPEGCEDIDGRLITFNGLRILGLGGCMRYHPGDHQYTEREMEKRVRRLKSALKKTGGVDIVISHAPPRGLGDLDDPAHRGFECFKTLIEAYSPRFWFHGHTHLRYNASLPREHLCGGTRVVNVGERTVVDLPDLPTAPEQKGEIVWITKPPRDNDGWKYREW